MAVQLESPIGPVPNLGDCFDEDGRELGEICRLLQKQSETWIRAHPEQWAYWDRLRKRIVQNFPR